MNSVYRNISLVFRSLCVGLVWIGMQLGCSSPKQPIPVADFFSGAEKTNFKISPDGQFIAYVGDYEYHRNIYLIDISDDFREERLTSETGTDITSYYWGDSTRLVFRKGPWSSDTLQMYFVDRHTKETSELLQPMPGVRMRWVAPNRIRDESMLLALDDREEGVFDVYRLSDSGQKRELVGRNNGNIIRWFTDPEGDLRMALASDSARETILYRRSEKEDFHVVTSNSFKSTIKPIGFCGENRDKIFALSNVGRDKFALVEYDVAKGEEIGVIYSHPDVDLETAGYLHDEGKMAYAAFRTSRRERHFLDADMEEVYNRLANQLSGFEISVVDWDDSRNGFVVATFTDRNPGATYYYNKTNDRLFKLADHNPILKDRELAEMKPISLVARDGLELHGYLTLPVKGRRTNLPVIVFPHSGPSDRNVWRFDPEVQFFADRGYAVFQLNYRGSTGYGKAFWTAGFKEWGGKIQDDLEDGVDWLIEEGIADPKRVGIYGFGFGGYAALQAASFKSDRYACAASYSGFANLFTYLREIPPHLQPYLQMYYEIIGDPEKESDLIKSMSPVFHSDKINIPIFLAQGGRDKWNSVTETNQFVQKLRKRKIPITYFLREDEGRFFQNKEDRLTLYNDLGDFFDKHLK